MLCAFAWVGNAQVYWQSDFGPWGGRVNDLCEDRNGTLFAGTEQGIIASHDEGATWLLFALSGQEAFGVHIARSGTMLASTKLGVLRSTDNGRNWINTEYLRTYTPGSFFEHSSGMLFCHPGYWSQDDGQHWFEVPSPLPYYPLYTSNLHLWSEAPSGEIMFHGFSTRVPDFQWTNDEKAVVDGVVTSVLYRFSVGGTHFVGWSREANHHTAILSSDDGGATWSVAYRLIDSILIVDRPEAFSTSGKGECLIRTVKSGYLFSLDYGKTWRALEKLSESVYPDGDALCTASGKLFATGRLPGLYYCDVKQGSWIRSIRGLAQTMVSNCVQRSDGKMFAYVSGLQEMQTSNDLVDWDSTYRFQDEVADIGILSSGEILAATPGSGVLRSTDDGYHWLKGEGSDPPVHVLLMRRDGSILSGGEGGILESSDKGSSWHRVEPAPGSCMESALERANGEIVFGGEAGIFIGSSDLKTWRSSRPSWMPVMSLAENAAGQLLAGTLDDGLYRSTDGGLSWESAGFAGQWITGIVAAEAAYCFLATRLDGMFESRDGGTTWLPYSEGLRSEEILDLVAGIDGHIYAGTTMGVARSRYPVLRSEYLTPDFTLQQNTPNPASGQAIFVWSIPRDGKVRMSVYDVFGRELSVVFEGSRPAGLHWQTVETTALVPGTYFCVLRYEGQMIDRKFQVLR
jgi:photosystem II stability/assembly factor-like uncharacterized protein